MSGVTGGLSRSALMVGRVSHSRLAPVPHAFAYRVYMLRLDLDEIAALDDRLRLFGTRRWRPVRFEPADYLGQPCDERPVAVRIAALRGHVVAALAAHGVSTPIERVEVLAHARTAGYVFNPISLFSAWDADGALAGLVADVHNTFGERHAYVLGAADAAAGDRWQAKKVFHVSPFFTRDGTYRFEVALSAARADLRIALHVEGRPRFVSQLALDAEPLSDGGLARALVRFPAMTARVIGAIHWQAARLWWKGLPYQPKPAHDPDVARRTTRA